MSSFTTDLLIVGGGVIGSALAYHCSRQGRRVLVIDRAAVATPPCASWSSAGGIRRQGRHPAEAALAREAIAGWPTLDAELDADLQYRQGGNLLIAESDAQAARLAGFVRKQHAIGFTDVRLIDGAELREAAPALTAQAVAGSYSPADGQADPTLTTRAFAAAAQRHGAIYWTDTIVRALAANGTRVVGARTSRTDVAAETTVVAAGVWSSALTSGLGLQLPIKPVAYQMLRSSPAAPDMLRPVLSSLGRRLSLKQLTDGSFLLGGGWLGDLTADQNSYELRADSLAGNWAEGTAVVPALATQRVASAWCGLEAESIDGLPFVGLAPGWLGLVLAVGFSGHGFAIAPAVGRALGDQLAGRRGVELDGLGPERIAQLEPSAIAAFRARPMPAAG